MNMKTGILALGWFTIAGVVTISCGGSSDESNNTGSSGSSTTAGSSSAGNSTGGSSSAGTSNNGGTTNNTAGTTNNTGGTTGGANNTAGNTSGGTNAGGDNTGPIIGAGGDGPSGCPATQPADGTACMRGDGGFLGCAYGDQVCRCTRQGQQMRTWQCDTANPGAGGDNGGFGTATCPDNAMTGDDCTGFGQCPNQQGCFCGNGNVFCQ